MKRHLLFALLGLAVAANAAAQLNENCTVSVLNRSIQVQADGVWILPNVPSNVGQVRARATCVENGVTRSGQSDYFLVPTDGVVDVAEIRFDAPAPIAASLTLISPVTLLTSAGATTQLTVRATYSNGSIADLSRAVQGTNYFTSNPRVATVDADGLVSAVSSGTTLLSAMNEGSLGMLLVTVMTSGDTDGDGMPDQFEIDNGLDPNNPADGGGDLDGDGLTNVREFQLGTGLRNADSDGDGLNDGDEVARGTSPLLADTDGDGIRDGLEVQTGSNPLDPNSYNLAQALQSLSISPASFEIVVNTVIGEGSRRVTVTGTLKDGTTLDLTSTGRGTSYSSSNLAVASFGIVPGEVFGGTNGTATVTATNAGFSSQATVSVRSFAPQALAFLPIPGFANNVDVAGNYAYVAAGAAGLVVVDVTDRRAPRIVGTQDTPGNANDVRVVGRYAYVADGTSGLQIIDVGTPTAPRLAGAVDTPGEAWDVAVSSDRAYVADGSAGLQIIDVSNPVQPRIAGTLDTAGTAKGVDVNGSGIAVVADGTATRIIDVTSSTAPILLGTAPTSEARDVVVDGNIAIVADFNGSVRVVSFATPALPAILASTDRTLGGIVTDVAKVGRFVFASDVFFVNGVSITDVGAPATPVVRARLDFPQRDDNGTGIAADQQFVYLTAERSITENGTTGDTRLYIGQYRVADDTAHIAPAVQLTSPLQQATVIERSTIRIAATATDDVLVSSVDFLVNGQIVATDSAEPYEISYRVPAGLASLAIQARATDVGGNSTTTPQVLITVIPDPGTTATGRVISESGAVAANASVTCVGISGTTVADGSFFIGSVPTVEGPVQCVTQFTGPDGVLRSGRSAAVAPVAGGITNVGTITLSSSLFPSMAGVLATFDFNGDVRDTSGNGRDGILIGGTFVPTSWDQGLRIVPPQPVGFDWSAYAGLIRHPYTIEMILTPATLGSWRKLFSFNDGADAGWYYFNNTFQAFPNGTIGSGLLAGQRHYLAFVSRDNSTMDVYFQGHLIGTTNASFTAPPVNAVFFRDDSGTGRNEQFDGTVEALRISGVNRTPAEIDAVQQRLTQR
jgi:hypothetical protein